MLTIKNISFSYHDIPVLEEISFNVQKGQNIALIGESGCGKSTLLKLIYGLYDLNEGEIVYNDKRILGPKFNLIPGEDTIKYLAQDFDLMPYITVEENVGKFLSNIYPEKKALRVQELLTMVEMNEFAKVKAQYLSGGQQQRVALARVLALEPQILLLDEPFSQIDTFRKNNIRRNLFQYLKNKNISCIMATHDSKDVLAFSDETIVLRQGKLIQKNKTKEVYKGLKNKYTASLFDEVNEIQSSLLNNTEMKPELVLLYPHQLHLVKHSSFKVKISHSYYRGDMYLIQAKHENQIVYFENKSAIEEGTYVFLGRQV